MLVPLQLVGVVKTTAGGCGQNHSWWVWSKPQLASSLFMPLGATSTVNDGFGLSQGR